MRRLEAETFTLDLEDAGRSLRKELGNYIRHYNKLLAKLNVMNEPSLLDFENDLVNRDREY